MTASADAHVAAVNVNDIMMKAADADEYARACIYGAPQDDEIDYVDGIFPEGDWDEGSDCYDDAMRGACYFAFPMCDKSTLVSDVSQNSDVAPAGDALPICYEHCIRERTQCRTVGSAFGSRQQIEKECGGGVWSLEELGSGLCTGAGSTLAPARSMMLCIGIAALVANVVV